MIEAPDLAAFLILQLRRARRTSPTELGDRRPSWDATARERARCRAARPSSGTATRSSRGAVDRRGREQTTSLLNALPIVARRAACPPRSPRRLAAHHRRAPHRVGAGDRARRTRRSTRATATGAGRSGRRRRCSIEDGLRRAGHDRAGRHGQPQRSGASASGPASPRTSTRVTGAGLRDRAYTWTAERLPRPPLAGTARTASQENDDRSPSTSTRTRRTRVGPTASRAAAARRRRELRITGGFWAEKQELNADVIIEHCLTLDGADRLDRQLRPGRRRAPSPQHHDGHRVRRLRGLQAARGDGVGARPPPAIPRSTARYRTLVARVAAAQEPDGYLHTCVRSRRPASALLRPGVGTRALLLRAPFQAAVARHPDRARRPARQTARGGSPTTSYARVRAGRAGRHLRASGDRAGPGRARPRAAASRATSSWPALFIERRGRAHAGDHAVPGAASTSSTTCPCARPSVLRGHAVRALYLVGGRRRRRRRDRRRRTAGGDRTPVAEHRRATHLPHRRDRLPPSERGVRRATTSCRPTARTRRPAPASAR